MLKGVIIGADSKEALAGAAIILCRIISNGECTIQAEIITTTDDSGRFSFSTVPSGEYVLLYDSLGKAIPIWKTINELTINYKPGHRIPGEVALPKEFFETFGGGGKIVAQRGTSIGLDSLSDDAIASIKHGSFTSEKYGLTIDFREGNPPTIEVTQGKSVEIEINAWGLSTPTPTPIPVPLTPTPIDQKEESQFLLVTGIVLNGDKAPLPNQTIYFIPLQVQGSEFSMITSWDKDGKIENPSTITDSEGKFTIKVPRVFIGRGNEFTVGQNPGAFKPKLLRKNGVLVTFKVDSQTTEINVGEFVVKE